MRVKMERTERIEQVVDLLKSQPHCWFTVGMVARYLDLSRSPYLQAILDQLVEEERIQVLQVARFGHPAKGYIFSIPYVQEVLPCI